MSIVNAVLAAVVSVALIGTVGVLTWHKDITGEAAVAMFSLMIGGGSVGTAAHVAVKTGARAANTRSATTTGNE